MTLFWRSTNFALSLLKRASPNLNSPLGERLIRDVVGKHTLVLGRHVATVFDEQLGKPDLILLGEGPSEEIE